MASCDDGGFADVLAAARATAYDDAYRAEFADGYAAAARDSQRGDLWACMSIIQHETEPAARRALADPDWMWTAAEALCEVERASRQPAPGQAKTKSMGLVYAIGDNGADEVKIGWTSKSAATRLRQLEKASGRSLVLLGSIRGTRQDESALHEAFAGARIRGEWFRRSPAVSEWIATVS